MMIDKRGGEALLLVGLDSAETNAFATFGFFTKGTISISPKSKKSNNIVDIESKMN